jgi:hypothetical protein
MNALEAARGKPTEAGLRSGRRLSEKSAIVGHRDLDGTRISRRSTLRPFIEAVGQYPKSEFKGGMICVNF